MLEKTLKLLKTIDEIEKEILSYQEAVSNLSNDNHKEYKVTLTIEKVDKDNKETYTEKDDYDYSNIFQNMFTSYLVVDKKNSKENQNINEFIIDDVTAIKVFAHLLSDKIIKLNELRKKVNDNIKSYAESIK